MTALERTISGEASREAIEALAAGQPFRLRVAGSSMRPALLAGDEVIAVRTAQAGWHAGDILVLDLPDAGLVVHRVLWTSRIGVRTGGQGSGRMDAPVPRDRVVGRVIEVRRDGRNVTEGGVARRVAWARQLTSAALHRLWRRLGFGSVAGGARGGAGRGIGKGRIQ